MGSGRIERNERSKRLAIVPSLVISDHSAVSIYFLLFFPFFTFRLTSWRHQRFRFYSRRNERRKGEDWRSLLRDRNLFDAIGLEINCDLIKEFGQYLEGKKKRTGAPATE